MRQPTIERRGRATRLTYGTQRFDKAFSSTGMSKATGTVLFTTRNGLMFLSPEPYRVGDEVELGLQCGGAAPIRIVRVGTGIPGQRIYGACRI